MHNTLARITLMIEHENLSISGAAKTALRYLPEFQANGITRAEYVALLTMLTKAGDIDADAKIFESTIFLRESINSLIKIINIAE